MPMDIHIVFTKSKMLLSKKRYESWREIQNEYEDYVASLGPWSEVDVAEYLRDDHPDLDPPGSEQVKKLVTGQSEVVVLTVHA